MALSVKYSAISSSGKSAYSTRGTEKPMDFAIEGLPPADGAHQGDDAD